MNLKDLPALYRLKEIAKILRSENGCPWDKEQTFESLKPYLIEEAYEVYDAIEKGSLDELKEELGDLLYQIYAHSEIASETSSFTIDDVAEGITNKLIKRHPHVFGNETITDADRVKDRWERIKKSDIREAIRDSRMRIKQSAEESIRADGNNVNLDVEQIEVARNTYQYQFALRQISDQLMRLRTAIEGR